MLNFLLDVVHKATIRVVRFNFKQYGSQATVVEINQDLNPNLGYENLKLRYREDFESRIEMIQRAELTVSVALNSVAG